MFFFLSCFGSFGGRVSSLNDVLVILEYLCCYWLEDVDCDVIVYFLFGLLEGFSLR